MRLLLDTHALLWWLADNPQLGAVARAQIADVTNMVFVSAVSAWEIEIKRALGKLAAPKDLALAVERSGFEPLPISIDHGIVASRLPPHHNDPFDRMLIAQGATEPLVVVTKDAAFDDYDVTLLDACS